MSIPVRFYLAGQASTSEFSKFTHEPYNELCVNKGNVSELFWRVESAESCLRRLNVDISDNHTLFPNQHPNDLPISETSEYNLTITGSQENNYCDSESARGFDVNVSLSLRFTDNVLQHVPFIHFGVIFKTSSEMSIWSKVSIISGQSDSCIDLTVLETTDDEPGSVTAKVTNYDNVTDVANTSTGIAFCVKSNLLLILTLLLLHQTASSILNFAGYICGFV